MKDNLYKSIFYQAFQKVREVRDPRAKRADAEDIKWGLVEDNAIFDFGLIEMNGYVSIINSVKEISIDCLKFIICELLKQIDFFLQIDTRSLINETSKVYFSFVDTNSKVLYIFKDIERGKVWRRDKYSDEIIKLLKYNKCDTCKYVYLMFENAYLQEFGYNKDSEEIGKGTNSISLKDFFVMYLGESEWLSFYSYLENYILNVKDYLGFITVKSLNSSSLISFRRITEHEIKKYEYFKIINKEVNKQRIEYDDFSVIEKQFQECFHILLGENDFAESIITAEWLFKSMNKAKAIDLTTIGMGYLKSVEQLIYDLICICDTSIDMPESEASIGAMATFYKKHMDVFRDELNFKTKKYIKERIFAFKDLRNGYFHKHNINDWNIIKSIRSECFEMAFLLLGSYKLSVQDKRKLGLRNYELENDYYKLCEYVNYHAGDVFWVRKGDFEDIYLGACDPNLKILNDRYIIFSGMYVCSLGNVQKIKRFTKEELPDEVTLGKIEMSGKNEVIATPIKVRKIFENGRFVGPSIVDEEELNY